MLKLRSLLVATALSIPIVALTPTPASAGMTNCSTGKGATSSWARCLTYVPGPPQKVRALLLCRQNWNYLNTVWAYGPYVGQQVYSYAYCPSGYGASEAFYQLVYA